MKQEKLILRQNIIRLYKKGKKQTEIAYALNIPQTTISYWIVRYNKTNNLEDKPKSGKPSQLSKEQFEEIKTALNDFPPSRYGGESMGWTTKMLIDFIKKKFNLTFGIRYAQKIMHKCGINLITPRTQHTKSSYAARVVYRDEFKKNSKKNIWVAPSLISTKQHLD